MHNGDTTKVSVTRPVEGPSPSPVAVQGQHLVGFLTVPATPCACCLSVAYSAWTPVTMETLSQKGSISGEDENQAL